MQRPEFGTVVRVRIETPRGSFVKRRSDGGIDFVAPLPCPFDYGSVLGTLAEDGDPLDALVLGGRRAAGSTVEATVIGRVRFVDAGERDDKLVCGPPGALDRTLVRGAIVTFFTLYAGAKRVRNVWRRRPGPTRFEGLERARSPASVPASDDGPQA